MVKLEDGKVYEDSLGNQERIGGTTHDYQRFVWTIRGNWYERSTGRFVRYTKASDGNWIHVPMAEGSPNNLIKEVPHG